MTEEMASGIAVDEALRQRLTLGEIVSLQGAELRDTRLYTRIPAPQREMLKHLHLFPVGSPGELLGVFLTTTLAPADARPEEQIDLTARVLATISATLRDRWQLESHQHRLRSTSEMLALRSVADRHFESPIDML
jgi:hypothetical protein